MGLPLVDCSRALKNINWSIILEKIRCGATALASPKVRTLWHKICTCDDSVWLLHAWNKNRTSRFSHVCKMHTIRRHALSARSGGHRILVTDIVRHVHLFSQAELERLLPGVKCPSGEEQQSDGIRHCSSSFDEQDEFQSLRLLEVASEQRRGKDHHQPP